MPDFSLDIAGGVATLTLRRPAKKNALTLPMVRAMAEAVAALPARSDVNVLVVVGEGGDFCAGADLVANAEALSGGGDGPAANMATFHALLRAVWGFPRPTLAAVAGDAVGFGMDLALACDLRLLAPTARFRQGFTKIGLVPDGGSSLTLQRLVGTAKAFELMYFSDVVGAEDAVRLGLANKVVPADALAAEVAAWTARLAAGPQKALRLGKANLRAAMGDAMEAALAREADAQVQCLTGPDPVAGVLAFVGKTTPQFTER